MDAAAMHAAFLDCLFRCTMQAAPPVASAIRVVARLSDARLLDPRNDRWLTLFLPDLHLVSPSAAAQYAYGFGKTDDRHHVLRGRLLEGVLDAGLAFWTQVRPAGRTIATYQLGDFLDLWREGEYAPGVGADQLVRSILRPVPWLVGKLLASGAQSLEADVVAGNHDRNIAGSVRPFTRAKRAFAPQFGRAGGPRPALILHGDVFDPVEGLRDRVAAYFLARFGKGVPGGEYAIAAPPVLLRSAADGAGLAPVINVRTVRRDAARARLAEAHEQLAGVQGGWLASAVLPRVDGLAAAIDGFRDGTHPTYRALRRAANLPPRLPELRLVVVGHSHHPRIVVVGDPDAPSSFVLADCGAWIESIAWQPARAGARPVVVPSAQVGVLCGDDLRIYQLDPLVAA